MNTYSKFAPNVFLAKCKETYSKGEEIQVSTKYQKENTCIVFNLIYEKDGFKYYSIVRADGFDSNEYAKKRKEKLENAAQNAEKKSSQYYEKSNKDRNFLVLGEPIKVGHHSEKRHRKAFEDAHRNMGKCVEYSEKAKSYESRIKYWEQRSEKIDLSIPDSLEYFEFKLEAAKIKYEGLKSGAIKKEHSFSLTYAKKEVNELEKKSILSKKLWE